MSDEMVSAGDAAAQWLRTIEAEIAKRLRWWEERGVHAGVREKPWKLSRRLLPRDITCEELAGIEPALYWAQERMEQCERCSPVGGACDVDYDTRAEKGKLPVWNNATRDLEFVWCKSHIEHLLRQRLAHFNVPSVLLGATFENFHANDALREEVRGYAENFATAGAASYHFVGSTGTGKSHIAAALVRALTEKRAVTSVYFAFVPKFFDDLRASFDRPIQERDAFVQRVLTCDLLVLDDLGAERTTEWVRDQLGILIHERWANERPIVVTSNAPLSEYRKLLGERAFSRLQALVPYTRPIDGEDRRKP